MTDITCTPPRSGLVGRLGGLLRAAVAAYAREAEMRAAIRTLSRFDEHLLHDIGLPREDIEAAVRDRTRR